MHKLKNFFEIVLYFLMMFAFAGAFLWFMRELARLLGG